jgi:hypothetical protein
MSDTPEKDALLDRVDAAMKLIEITRRERDEAREKANQWERIALRVDTERAEVREENAKLRYVAERAIEAIPYTEGYGGFSYAASVLREELNQIKDCSNE